MVFQSRNLQLLNEDKLFVPTRYGQIFVFWSKTQRIPYIENVSFFGDSVQAFLKTCVPESFVQKMHSAIIQLKLWYKRFQTVTPDSRKMSF